MLVQSLLDLVVDSAIEAIDIYHDKVLELEHTPHTPDGRRHAPASRVLTPSNRFSDGRKQNPPTFLDLADSKKAVGKREAESIQVAAVQVDDLLTFRQFSKKLADDPIDKAGGEAEGEDKDKAEAKTEGSGGGRPRVLADGTYAAETAYTSASSARLEAVKAASKPPLGALILGDFFTGAVLASTLTKLVLRFDELTSDRAKANAVRAEAMLIVTSTIHVGQSKFVAVPIDEDSNEQIPNCIQTLSELREAPAVHNIFLKDTEAAYSKMLGAQEKNAVEKREAESTQLAAVQVDDLLTFRQFSKKSADGPIDYVEDLGKATGAGEPASLTPIYAEAYVKTHGFDILLDVLLVNQAPNTLQNLCLDFATLGDLKLVERPAAYTVAPHEFQSIKATIKVRPSFVDLIFHVLSRNLTHQFWPAM
ncbi:hypothetical protein BV22DRAFT_1134999 [Leucogyrophana mollusca]|uniref:Uncharacterized protein n=1 Tax=Leucogyrophana mollusca TaxID=85980 RepID=A0ACB8AXF4_9AGAM|nr:hypothetical protein BV22DRAFT_1134999 [Leucogyrophana mollusca]